MFCVWLAVVRAEKLIMLGSHLQGRDGSSWEASYMQDGLKPRTYI